MFLMCLNLSLALMFLFLTHPLSMGGILLIQTMLTSLILGNFNINFWYSYILFLIMVGGMLVLFIYMTSVASNEKFKMNYKLLTLLMLPPMSMLMEKYKIIVNMNMMNNEFMKFNETMQYQSMMNKYMNWPSSMILMFIIIYLLIALIAVVKITDLSYGPLRSSN